MSNRRSKKFEKAVAKDISGGSVQPASEALPYWKHDVRGDFWLVEHKYTEAESFSIKKKYFQEVLKNAFKDGKLPVMVVEFPNKPELKLAVIRYDDFLALDEYLKKEEDADKNL